MTKPAPLTLCEWLAEHGGLRMALYGRPTMGSSDLKALDAHKWHRGRPFRKRLLRTDSGMAPDYATLAAWEAGYFPRCVERPDLIMFLDAVASDLASGCVYSEFDREELMRLDQLSDETQHKTSDYNTVEVDYIPELVLRRKVAPRKRLVPDHAKRVDGEHGQAVFLYERASTTRRGRHITPYLAKLLNGKTVMEFCAKAYRGADTMEIWHKRFESAVARAWYCDDFLNGPPF